MPILTPNTGTCGLGSNVDRYILHWFGKKKKERNDSNIIKLTIK